MDTVHECDRQTDRQTDGRTDRITITDTVQTASHGKNKMQLSERCERKSFEKMGGRLHNANMCLTLFVRGPQ